MKKKNIIISITILVLVTLILLGLTYAYYRTRIVGNTNEKSISVSSKLFEIVYTDGTSNVALETTFEPSSVITKEFSIENTGSDTVENYKVYLENVINQFELKSDIVYTLSCTSYENYGDANQTVSGTCNGASERTFPSARSIIATNTIDAGITHLYKLQITYKETGENQSVDMNKKLSAKINIYDADTRFLSTEILANAESQNSTMYVDPSQLGILENTSIPGQTVSLESEKVLSYTFDNYGTSYYYRGSVEDNYVNYSGMCWRIVRIQGNGTIKLVLADENNECNNGYNIDNTMSAFIDERTDIPYLEEWDGFNFVSSYLESYIPSIVTVWMEREEKKFDTSQMVDSDWVFDSSGTSSEECFEEYNCVLYTYYGGYERLKDILVASPSLYSKSGVFQTNIAMLTADEVAFAGGVYGVANNTYYLNTNANGSDYWTLTPYMYEYMQNTVNYIFVVSNTSGLSSRSDFGNASVRPAIVLKSDTKIITDETSEYVFGTYQNPYVIVN